MIIATADVGGSKTCVGISRDGVLGKVHRSPGNAVRPGRGVTAATSIADAVRVAMAAEGVIQVDALVVGAAGAGRATDADEMRAVFTRERIANKVLVVSDVELALAAFGTGPRVVLIAGTGSIAFGESASGTRVRSGGYGWRIGDEGGGYWIAREGLAAAAIAEDGRGRPVSFTQQMLEATRSPTFRDLVGWTTIASAREVATLAPIVVAAARNGDDTAAMIVSGAIYHLASLVNSLAPKFDLPEVPVGFAGGLVGAEGPLRDEVASRIEAPFVTDPKTIEPLDGGPILLTRQVA